MRKASVLFGAAMLSVASMAHAAGYTFVNPINFNDAAGTNFTSNFVNTSVLLGGTGGTLSYSTSGVTPSGSAASAVIYDGTNGGLLTPITTGAYNYTPINSSDFTVSIGFTMGANDGIGVLFGPQGSTTPNNELIYYSNDYSGNGGVDSVRYFPYAYTYGQAGVQGSYAPNPYSTIDTANITSGTLSFEYAANGSSAQVTTTITPTGSTTGYTVSQMMTTADSAGYITNPEVGIRLGAGSTVTSFGVYSNVAAIEPTWTLNATGNWNSAANWGGTIPNAIGAQADLLGALTANHAIYTDTSVTVGSLVFNNSTASYAITGAVGASMTFQTSTGSALVNVQAGTHELNIPLILASNTTFQTDTSSASLIIANPMTINAGKALTTTGSGTVNFSSIITLQSGAAMNIASSTQANALALAAGSTATLNATATGSKTVLQLGSLSNTLGGTLNLNNNDVIVDGGTTVAAVNAQVASGYNGGAWTGAGINSTAAASDSTHLHAVGVAPVTAAGTFDSAAVAAGDVLVKYTYYGDANLDGKVDGSDYSVIDNAYLADKTTPTAYTGWSNGDFNYDGVINGSDYTLIDNAFNTQGAQIASQLAAPTAQIAGGTSAVPEPATLGLLGIGTLGLLGKRRRRT